MTPGPLRLPAALALAVAAALATNAAFPSAGIWPLAFVGVAGFYAAVRGLRTAAAALIGFGYGVTFTLANVWWAGRYLGPIPWVALSVFEALWFLLLAVAVAFVTRLVPRIFPGWCAQYVGLPALVAALWITREQAAGSLPYGGFPWARIALSQAESPLAPVVSWVGLAGLGFLMVFVVTTLEAAVRSLVTRAASPVRGGSRHRPVLLDRPPRRWLAFLPGLATLLLLSTLPIWPTTVTGTLRVGAVQGNGRAAYFDAAPAGSVTAAQLAATAPLVGTPLDLLVWPEGGVDANIGPGTPGAAQLDALAASTKAPLLLNTITRRGDRYYNTSFIWQPGVGPTQLYDKHHPVPFGEYVPDRWFFRTLAPGLVDLIGRDYSPGDTPPVARIGNTTVGLAICFDVIYDDVAVQAVEHGASVFVYQTNNADFRGTDENLQQLASARLRAIETGRSVVNVSTVGTSEIILADGTTVASLPVDTAGVLSAAVPERTGTTLAVLIGPALQLILIGAALAGLAMTTVVSRTLPPQRPPRGRGPRGR